jgi:hypothetical protein
MKQPETDPELVKIRKALERIADAAPIIERLMAALVELEGKTPSGKSFLRVNDVSGR